MYVRVFQGTPQHPTGLRRQWLHGEWSKTAAGCGADDAVGGLASSGQWFGVLRWAHEPIPVPQPHGVLEGLLAEVRSFDSADVEVLGAGCPAEGATFVQVMEARVADRAGWSDADKVAVPLYAAARPDWLGSLRIWRPGGRLTVLDSFTSEAEARAGEAAVPTVEEKAAYDAWFGFMTDVEWHDLQEPWRD
jgi:hypothetical protein